MNAQDTRTAEQVEIERMRKLVEDGFFTSVTVEVAK